MCCVPWWCCVCWRSAGAGRCRLRTFVRPPDPRVPRPQKIGLPAPAVARQAPGGSSARRRRHRAPLRSRLSDAEAQLHSGAKRSSHTAKPNVFLPGREFDAPTPAVRSCRTPARRSIATLPPAKPTTLHKVPRPNVTSSRTLDTIAAQLPIRPNALKQHQTFADAKKL